MIPIVVISTGNNEMSSPSGAAAFTDASVAAGWLGASLCWGSGVGTGRETRGNASRFQTGRGRGRHLYDGAGGERGELRAADAAGVPGLERGRLSGPAGRGARQAPV